MERTQDGDTVAQYEKAQESWFAHVPSALAQMGVDVATVEQHEGPRHVSPAYHQGIEEWGQYYAAVGVTREAIGEDPRTPRERLKGVV